MTPRRQDISARDSRSCIGVTIGIVDIIRPCFQSLQPQENVLAGTVLDAHHLTLFFDLIQ
jgi:hypothetical protein